tara:strand:+ start:14030 stop:14494 length:465 start_codon:yes stop_codon:yes gene_type:complete
LLPVLKKYSIIGSYKLSIWKSKTEDVSKPWGSVREIPAPFAAKGKIINLEGDKRTSLKYYPHLDQVLYCLSGKVLVHAPDEKEFGDFTKNENNYFELLPGDLINIQAGNPYRLMAFEDSVLIEVLIGHRSSEKIMLEDDYGRIKSNKQQEINYD